RRTCRPSATAASTRTSPRPIPAAMPASTPRRSRTCSPITTTGATSRSSRVAWLSSAIRKSNDRRTGLESGSMSDSKAKQPKIVTAAILVIGNEILSGRTKDANLHYLATGLTEIGVRLMEARVVPDIEGRIIDAVNALRAQYDHVFTTGGIGPTHDDITSESIAKAFGVKLIKHPKAVE